tara:strand:+ start:149 stop:328 length:180 start_codon:yes stop_codon:yes gene_type:complete
MKKLNTDKHYKAYLYMGYVWVGIVVIMLFLTSCATTQTAHKCELMEHGKKCLPDHSCCK